MEDWNIICRLIQIRNRKCHICQYVCIEQELKNFIWAPEGEEINEKFSNLVFRDFGVRTKFHQKESLYVCESSRKWHQIFGKHTK